MVDPMRRKLLKTGAAATMADAAPLMLAEPAAQGAAPYFYQLGPVRIRYGRPMDLAGQSPDEIVATIDRTLRDMYRAMREGDC